MSAAEWMAGVVIVVRIALTLRDRKCAGALTVLFPSTRPVSPQHTFVIRSGVDLDEATKRAASALAVDAGIEVLDLVPQRLPSWRANLLLDSFEPRNYRADRVATGVSAGEAMLVRRDLLERARITPRVVQDAAEMLRLAKKLKRYAVVDTDVAVSPTLRASRLSRRECFAQAREAHGTIGAFLKALLPLLSLVLLGPVVPVWTAVALLAHQLRPVLATAGTGLRPLDRWRHALLRSLSDLAVVMSRPAGKRDPTFDSALRETYRGLLSSGTARFFEPPRPDCPLCGGRELHQLLRSRDMVQHKPGTFTLVECRSCEHVFQNPRLSLEGLDFYYRDAYDGLGEEMFDKLFARQAPAFRARVAMVRSIVRPDRWLDVGAGHGHFCCYASGMLPETCFDGLDVNAGIEEAERRRWVRRGVRGLFPEHASQLTEGVRYDVVSMSHYLEHTLDPQAEVAAAARALRDGGALMVEVPNPDSRMGRFLGRFWLPWLQPQHLHFVNARNLERLLRQHSLEPVRWHQGRAHLAHDFMLASMLFVNFVALPGDAPWLPRMGPLRRAWRVLAWTCLWPLVVLAWLLDQLLRPLIRSERWTNTYRVVALKREAAIAAAAE